MSFNTENSLIDLIIRVSDVAYSEPCTLYRAIFPLTPFIAIRTDLSFPHGTLERFADFLRINGGCCIRLKGWELPTYTEWAVIELDLIQLPDVIAIDTGEKMAYAMNWLSGTMNNGRKAEKEVSSICPVCNGSGYEAVGRLSNIKCRVCYGTGEV